MEHHHEETRECLSHSAETVRDTAKVLGHSTGGSGRLYWCQARGVDLCAYEVLCRRMDCEDSHKAAQPESRIPSARLVDWVRLRGHLRTPGRAGTPHNNRYRTTPQTWAAGTQSQFMSILGEGHDVSCTPGCNGFTAAMLIKIFLRDHVARWGMALVRAGSWKRCVFGCVVGRAGMVEPRSLNRGQRLQG